MIVVWGFQENAPGNISAEEKRLLDRLVTFGRRKGLHLSKDTQEVMKTQSLQSSFHPPPSLEWKSQQIPAMTPSVVCLCFQEIKRTSKRINELSIEFNRNLNEDTTFLVFPERELGERPRQTSPVATDTPSHAGHFLQVEWPTATSTGWRRRQTDGTK